MNKEVSIFVVFHRRVTKQQQLLQQNNDRNALQIKFSVDLFAGKMIAINGNQIKFAFGNTCGPRTIESMYSHSYIHMFDLIHLCQSEIL